jgi:hypothetical protein
MAQQCTVCGHEVGDQAQLCAPCTGGVIRSLRDLPGLAAELHVTMSRQDQMLGRSEGGKSSETPLFWKTRAGDTLRVLRDMLRRWTEQFTGVPPAESDHPVATLCVYLLNIVGDIRQHESGGQFATACRDAVTECRRTIDRPPELLYLGPCGIEDADEAVCREELYARPGADAVHCRVCGAAHSVDERRTALLERVENQLVTYSEASQALPKLMEKPLKVGTIRQWVFRDQLPIKGFLHKQYPRDVVLMERSHPNDSPLVRVGDVIRLALSGPAVKPST